METLLEGQVVLLDLTNVPIHEGYATVADERGIHFTVYNAELTNKYVCHFQKRKRKILREGKKKFF